MIRQLDSKHKASGIDWVGNIPDDWQVKKLKYLTQCLDGQRVPLNAEQRGEMQGEYPYWGANGIVDYVNDWLFDEELVLLGEDGAPFFERGKDVAFRVHGKIWVNNHAHVLRTKGILPKILVHILNTVDYRAFIDGSTRDKLTQSDMGSIPIQLPPVENQNAILEFIEVETSKINDAITNKQKLIELLKEKRQALITHAVTKGLDPNAKLKASGVDWLGDIPEGWEVKALRYGAKIIMGQSPDSEDYESEENGMPFLQGNKEFTAVHPIAGLWCQSANKRCKEGDILLSVRAPVGATNLADREYGIGRGLCAVRGSSYLQPFLTYLLGISAEHLNVIATGSTFTAISVDDVKSLKLPLPPISEQKTIIDYLDRKTARIDEGTNRIENQIENLREYRQALITNAVTGKIRVMGN